MSSVIPKSRVKGLVGASTTVGDGLQHYGLPTGKVIFGRGIWQLGTNSQNMSIHSAEHTLSPSGRAQSDVLLSRNTNIPLQVMINL